MKIRLGIAMIILGYTSLTLGDDEEMARFKREYPEAGRKLEEQFSRVKGTCRLSRKVIGARTINDFDEAQFASDHGYEKVLIRRNFSSSDAKSSAFDFVSCIGADSNFCLTRSAGTKDFIVESIGTTESDRSTYLSVFGMFFKAHYGVFSRPMTRIMATPGFRVLDAVRVKKDGRALVRVDYVFGTKEPITRSAVVLDPEAGWIIRSSEMRPGIYPDRLQTFDVEYGPPRDGYLLPLRVTFRDRGSESTCDFVDWSFEPTPESEFSMPFYGLPDLASRVKSHRNTLPYWLAGIAATGLVLALILRRFAARAKS